MKWTEPDLSKVRAILEEKPLARIMATRPADWNDYPEQCRPGVGDIPDIAAYEPGWVEINCELCGIQTHMGVRQNRMYTQIPNGFIVADMLCAALAAAAIDGSIVAHHLGGP